MSLRTVAGVVACAMVWGLAWTPPAHAQKSKRNAQPEQAAETTSENEASDPLSPLRDRSSSPVEIVVRQAQTAYQQQKFEECIDLTSQVLNANPRHAVARYHRASALIDVGRRDHNGPQIRAGIADAREALGIAGRQYLIFHIPYFYGLTSLAEFENKPPHARLAVEVATPLLSREDLPANVRPLVYYQRALARMYLREFLGAAADYGEAARLDPKFQAAHFGRADAYLKAGDPARARASFDQAVAVLPEDELVYNNRGTFNVQQGRIDAAIADFTKALELNSGFSMAALNRGFSRTQKLDWAAAERDYELALEGDSKQVLAWRLLGTARVAQGKLSPATAAFTNAINLNPADADNHSGRGFAKFFAKDYPGATTDFTKALELKPTSALFALWRYAAQVRAGKEAAAREELEAFLATLPATPNWHVTLSQYLLDKVDDAALLKAADVSTDASVKAQWLCEAHYFQGLKSETARQPAEAKLHFEECLKTNQSQLTAYIGAKLALAGK